uniref:Transcription initiation factor TFIID subunit 10 n=1 Tax=Steinernema glaseri TaxID=37863 RepID=A0A1I7ZRN5_9BILA
MTIPEFQYLQVEAAYPSEKTTTPTFETHRADAVEEFTRQLDEEASPESKLLTSIKEFEPTIPDAVALYYANSVGITKDGLDPRALRLVTLAAQMFVADIISDAALLNRMKDNRQWRNGRLGPRTTLTNDTLKNVLLDYDIAVPNPSSSH